MADSERMMELAALSITLCDEVRGFCQSNEYRKAAAKYRELADVCDEFQDLIDQAEGKANA